MSEWKDKYNPFNSWKALVHADNFEAILDGKPKPPIVVNFDLTNACNYACGFCMFGGERDRGDENSQKFRKGNARLPVGYSLQLPALWKEWGVKASCLAGGGEPTLHADCLPLIEEYGKAGLELGLVTNGYLVNNQEWWNTINENAKFVGFSIDAGTSEAYQKTKRVDSGRFRKVLSNLENLAKTKAHLGTRLQIGYKFVLDPQNWQTIYQAAQNASRLGANHFQFRPAIDQDHTFYLDKLNDIWDQIESAQSDFNSDDFHVYGVRHKFNPDLSKKHDFDKCRATPLTTTWCADGKVYMCTDTRGTNWSYLTDHYPDPQKAIDYWGSEDHLKKVDSIDFSKCDRCTLAPYNEMFEQVFMQDKMDRNLI